MTKDNKKIEKAKEINSDSNKKVHLPTVEEIIKEEIIVEDDSKDENKTQIKMSLETFLNHFFLKPGNRLYYLKTFGKDREETKTFDEWSSITGKK